MTATELHALRHPKAGQPDAQYVYHDASGAAILVANRFDRPDGSKFFLPYDPVRQEWKAPERRPLYRLPEVTAAANTNRPVIVTEGEKCADALAALGYVSTTTFGGANGAGKADLAPLKGRAVILWPDKDAPGRKYAEGLAVTLHREFGTLPRIVPVADLVLRNITGGAPIAANDGGPNVAYPKGWDAADAVAAGWGVRQINTLLALARPLDGTREPAPDDDAPAPLFDGMELWHTPRGEPFISIRRGGHWETFALDGSTFKRLLAHAEYQASGKTPSASKLDDQVRQMIGQALFEGERREAFTRIGRQGDALVLDLGAADWSAVEITASGWRVRQAKEPRFKRAPSMAALPVPIAGSGDLDALRAFVNVGSDQDFRLMVGWLLGCLRPSGPYPLLILTGEQGSAKSTTSKVLRALVDPSELETRSFPGDERDLVIAAQGAHVLVFDNLSRIKPSMADALCRLATGGGFATRKLHSDADEVLFDATRPCILNGIPDLAERADLADRAIALTLPTISETGRVFEQEFWERFAEAQPRILAALLDAAACALDKLDAVTLAERPRMADFARWVTAAEPALRWPPGAFLEAYQANRRALEETALDGNALASAILALLADHGPWRGTATDWIAHLRRCYPALTDAADAFPRKPAAFGAELRRIAPLLRRRGIRITHDREGKDRRRVIIMNQA
ncbi:hypothetical protein SAMN05444722_0021 [Rhodovulum sp. ES.010]|uniref:hypothetical protein n=1 Tax=Rhodovulum sp. ES.010 TaxID=1882821 RepID=UPI000928FEDF|nr:hypothetical protein [Rhodovulum sp. ES.010]SIN98772.1 hypothetical protein SAMN05444722_0021 [Rhodovulum sp. ES.010]